MTSEEFVSLRGASPPVQALIREFPPLCRVRALRSLYAPAPERFGRVVSYRFVEESQKATLCVVDEDALFGEPKAQDDFPGTYECEPEWLEVVLYDGNKTPDWVDLVLAGEEPETQTPAADNIVSGVLPDRKEVIVWVVNIQQPVLVTSAQIKMTKMGHSFCFGQSVVVIDAITELLAFA